MSTGTLNGCPARTAVCLVERSPLAASQLLQILETDQTLEVHIRSEVIVSGHTDINVFVIDRGTLNGPLAVLLTQIEIENPEAKLVIIDEPISKEELCTLLSAGIHGFLAYRDINTKLLGVIHFVAAGRLTIPSEILEEYVIRLRAALAKKKQKQGMLTPREQTIADLATQRLSNKEIASMLRITESTVKFHLSNIFSKLGVRTRELIPAPHSNNFFATNGMR